MHGTKVAGNGRAVRKQKRPEGLHPSVCASYRDPWRLISAQRSRDPSNHAGHNIGAGKSREVVECRLTTS